MGERQLDHLELLSIANKDEQYQRDWLEDDLQEIFQQCLGTRRWIQYRNAISVLSRFGYFAMTSLFDRPTPGEEFCNARPPQFNFLSRLMTIMLNNELRVPSEVPKSYAKFIQDINLVTYFLFNDFYELCKRVTNYTYSSNERTTCSTRTKMLSRVLGSMVMAKMAINVANESQMDSAKSNQAQDDKILSSAKEPPPTPQKAIDPQMICHLCSEARKDPTSTICGHIFCWTCIHQWLKERSECPICRTPTEPSRLIYLVNFR